MKKLLTLLLPVLMLFTLAKILVLDDPDILCMIAEGFHDPSTPYYQTIDRLYKLAESQNFTDKFLDYLKSGKNEYLHDHYIRAIGVVGNINGSDVLIDLYGKYQHELRYEATIYTIIASIGLIGDTKSARFLENLLKNPDDPLVKLYYGTIVRSIYLITGRSDYEIPYGLNKKSKLVFTMELVRARKIILESRGRKRTYDEMISLDKLFRGHERVIDGETARYQGLQDIRTACIE